MARGRRAGPELPSAPTGCAFPRLLRAEQSVPEPITSTGPKQVSLRLN